MANQQTIEDILNQVAQGKTVHIKKSDLPPEMYASIMELVKPTLGQKIGNVVTGKLNSIPGYGEYDAGSSPAAALLHKAVTNPKGYVDPKFVLQGPDVASAAMAQNLTPDDLAKVKAYQAYSNAGDPKAKLDLLKIFDPETAATAANDPFGNPYVTQGNQKLYLNKPGISGEDLNEVGAMTRSAAPVALGAGAGRMAASEAIAAAPKVAPPLLTRVLTGAGVGGSASVINDKAAQAGGSQQPVSVPAAAANAIGGAAGELASPLIAKAGSALFYALKGSKFFLPSGNLNGAGQNLLNKAGVDWNSLSQEMQARIRDQVRQAVDPVDLVQRMSAQDLPAGPIRLTKGQAAGDTGQYADEDLLRSGAMGNDAAARMKEFDLKQAGDIKANQAGIADVLNPGGTRQQNWGQGGSSVVEALQAKKTAAKAAVDSAYSSARDAGKQAWFPSVDSVKQNITNNSSVSGVLNPDLLETDPVYAKAWADFNKTFGSTSADPKVADPSVTVQKSFEFLQRLNALSRNNPTSYATRELKRQVSKQLADDALTSTIEGDPAAVDAFLNANKLYKNYAGTYKAGDLVEALTEQKYDPSLGKQVYAVDPSDGSKMILGASRLGLINKTGTKAALQTLQKQLPPEAWNNLREEVFLRAMGWGEKDFSSDAGLVQSAAQFKSGLAKMKQQSPELYNTLFSPKEQALLQRFGDTYAQATMAPATKSTLGSRTTPLAMRAAQTVLPQVGARLMPSLGPKLSGMVGIIPRLQAFKDAAAGAKVTDAIGADALGGGMTLPARSPAPLGVGAAASIPFTDSAQGSAPRLQQLIGRYSALDPVNP